LPPEKFPGLKISPKCFCGRDSTPGSRWESSEPSPDPVDGLAGGREGKERRERERRGGKNHQTTVWLRP